MEIRELEFADYLDKDCELAIDIYRNNRCNTYWINKEEATQLVEHLRKLFSIS